MTVSHGFGGRRRTQREDLPPGQYDAGREWPVLTAVVTPHLDPQRWTMSVDGLVDTPTTWSWDEMHALPQSDYEGAIHCVTTWSKFGMTWDGVSVDTLLAVAGGEVAPALRFALLACLPWMLLWAIVPFTHTLMFKPSFGFELVPGKGSVALDVLRAMALGVVVSALSLLSWSLPFVSLTRAFASPGQADQARLAAARTTLYRIWIIPFGLALFSLLIWAMPAQPSAGVVELSRLACHFFPRMLVLIHCNAMARHVGASGLSALAPSFVPLVVEWAVGLTLERGITMLLPPAPEG